MLRTGALPSNASGSGSASASGNVSGGEAGGGPPGLPALPQLNRPDQVRLGTAIQGAAPHGD